MQVWTEASWSLQSVIIADGWKLRISREKEVAVALLQLLGSGKNSSPSSLSIMLNRLQRFLSAFYSRERVEWRTMSPKFIPWATGRLELLWLNKQRQTQGEAGLGGKIRSSVWDIRKLRRLLDIQVEMWSRQLNICVWTGQGWKCAFGCHLRTWDWMRFPRRNCSLRQRAKTEPWSSPAFQVRETGGTRETK